MFDPVHAGNTALGGVHCVLWWPNFIWAGRLEWGCGSTGCRGTSDLLPPLFQKGSGWGWESG